MTVYTINTAALKIVYHVYTLQIQGEGRTKIIKVFRAVQTDFIIYL